MQEHYILSDGFKIPKVGFGTYQLNGYDGVRRIEQAISAGYRLLDSAVNYENEGAVGRAVKNSGVSRDELTVTSKLPGRYHGYQDAVNTIQESVLRTGLDYIDLYLIHWPNPIEDKYVEAWQALVDAQKAGLVRSIGVSNFLPEHIERLEKETGVLPVINQVELHPFFNQETQRAFDASKQIITQAWSPLGRASAVLKEQTIVDIAEKHKKSIAQVILRWQVQLGVLPIPKSSSIVRQEENLNLFDFSLSEEEMAAINQLMKQDGRRKGQDPAVYQEF
ncbi:aldo/keto reductase [Atopococcus tabaci]|uniref:aldo/keto reductase n=1 Tax=Atopococcus tabaci TaxID=269774 RepID=UPI0024097852|nr:aldo/keto reductase [Atopococcus tabaci]